MKASDVMITQLVTGTPELRLYQALALMEEKHIRHLPLVAEGVLVGILTDRDVKRHMSAAFRTDHEKAEDRASMLVTVADVMTRDPHSVHPDTPLKDVVKAMIEHKFGAVPVVDAARRPVGIITSIDLLRLLLPHV